MKTLNRHTTGIVVSHPERVVQFGAGNFLRGFVDWIIQELNDQAGFDSSVVVVKVTPNGTYESLDAQDGLFHVHIEGIQNGEFISKTQLISCISRAVYPYEDYESYLALARQPEIRFLISNTTEAGIQFDANDQATDQPPTSFPAKLTVFLYERFRHLPDNGCIIIPTELVVDNGAQLREMILKYTDQWGLGADFAKWIQTHNMFCNTLVDRIVPGYLQNVTLDYDDKLLVMGEPYHSWIIEAPASLKDELPTASLNIKIVDDAEPYRETKVRILNGLHTSMVPIGYLLGLETVRDCIDHPVLGQFLQDEVYKEIIPMMTYDDLEAFTEAVFDRFRNPSIHHKLLSIAVNSSAKVKTRILPTLQDYMAKYQTMPQRLALALAAFVAFYQDESAPLNDDAEAIAAIRQDYKAYLGVDLDHYLAQIQKDGILSILEQLNG